MLSQIYNLKKSMNFIITKKSDKSNYFFHQNVCQFIFWKPFGSNLIYEVFSM